MAFENIDVTSLRGAIYACRDSLNYNTTKELVNTFSNEDGSSVQSKLKSSMQKLMDLRYKELENYLDNCIEASNKIEEYKMIEKEKQQYEKELIKLNEKLSMSTLDASSIVLINNQIKQINTKIFETKNQLEEIETKVKNIL